MIDLTDEPVDENINKSSDSLSNISSDVNVGEDLLELEEPTKKPFITFDSSFSRLHPGLIFEQRCYYLRHKMALGKRNYVCRERRSCKCPGSITISKSLDILKQVPHTCLIASINTDYYRYGKKMLKIHKSDVFERP